MKGGRILEEPTGIWVLIVFVWPVLRKVFVVAVIALLLGFCFWALGRVVRKLKAKFDDYPLFDALYLSAWMAGV
jgi:hypothetical protein